MLAARLEEANAPLVIGEHPEPAHGPGGIVLPVAGCGVCRSDLHIQAGQTSARIPLVPGHEVAVVDEEVGPALVYGAWGCGRCRLCRAGEEQLCPDAVELGWRHDGGYAERMAVPDRRYLVPLDGLDPIRAAPLADAGLTSFRAVRRARPALAGGGDALVVGAGGLGQFAIQWLRRLTHASRVIVVDPDERKRRLALELGADLAYDPREWAGRSLAVLDLVGTDESLALSARTVERAGILVLVGEARGAFRFGFDSFAVEAIATASILGSLADLREVVEHARRGEVDWHVEALPLVQANDALERLKSGDVRGRLVLVPPSA